MQPNGQPAAAGRDAHAGADARGLVHGQIQAHGYLNVGVDDNTYLWGYRDPARAN